MIGPRDAQGFRTLTSRRLPLGDQNRLLQLDLIYLNVVWHFTV